MSEIELHDTASGELLALPAAAVKRAIGIYACGPTVYSRIHVGNARPFVIFSVLARFLRHESYDVKLVINVTDVNDKIYDAARAQGVGSEPLDFALWKAHKEGEDTQWPAPWGAGRPGWHIECSTMAEQGLPDGVDIHGGGSDLVFPHHENEAAQTRSARGHELARIWMHNGMIQSTGEKMAKSVGNIAALHEVVERYGPEAVVMYLISGHYRQPLAFSEEALEQAAANVKRIREAGRRLTAGEP